MFTGEQRDHVRNRVLELARADPRVTAGALTGSTAFGAGDAWSDIDVAFGIAEGNVPEAVLDDWTQVLDREFSVLDHFDLRSGSSIYRVFLLPSGLEVDVAVTPAEEFGARGPHFRALFGTTHQLEATHQPSAEYLIGLCWHHVLHARSCIERNKPWQAEYWISGIRDHALALACIRLGENAVYGRGVDRLPAAVTDPLADALVRSLDESELRRALAVATMCLIGELEEWDSTLCTRLKPLLQEFGASQAEASAETSSEHP
jgi:predicted nucleotidyltransferase